MLRQNEKLKNQRGSLLIEALAVKSTLIFTVLSPSLPEPEEIRLLRLVRPYTSLSRDNSPFSDVINRYNWVSLYCLSYISLF